MYVSYTPITNVFSGPIADTIINKLDLIPIRQKNSLPDSFSVTFRVPDTVFNSQLLVLKNSGIITDSQYTSLMILLPLLATADPIVLASLGPLLTPELTSMISLLSTRAYTFFTAHTKDGKRLVVRSEFVVRYNSVFESIPSLSLIAPVNYNPIIRWIKICKLPKALGAFNPTDRRFASDALYSTLFNRDHPDSISDTIIVDTGYSYWVVVDSSLESIPLSLPPDNFFKPISVNENSSLIITAPACTLRIPCKPLDTIAVPLVFVRDNAIGFDSAATHRVFATIPGDTIFFEHGDSISIRTNDTSWIVVPKTKFEMSLTTRDFGITNFGTVHLEEYLTYHFYQNLDASALNLPQDSLVAIESTGEPVAPLLPPLDVSMHRFALWSLVQDRYTGSTRPYGTTIQKCTGYFKFTDAYKDKVKL